MTGEPMMAKPCSGCEEAISLAGIRRVIYTKPE
jgi:tRNA(Arg) A34 adenosine deaminase TadA